MGHQVLLTSRFAQHNRASYGQVRKECLPSPWLLILRHQPVVQDAHVSTRVPLAPFLNNASLLNRLPRRRSSLSISLGPQDYYGKHMSTNKKETG